MQNGSLLVLWHMDVIFDIQSPLPHTSRRKGRRAEEKVRNGDRVLMVLTNVLDEIKCKSPVAVKHSNSVKILYQDARYNVFFKSNNSENKDWLEMRSAT